MAEGKHVVILGAGPAGYVGALRAAQLGMKVTVVDNRPLGGTCLNRGCIPTKALLGSAAVVRMMDRAEEYGIQVRVEDVSWPAMRERSEKVVARLVRGIDALFKAAGVRFVSGDGRIGDERTVVVAAPAGEESITGDFVLVATGSEAARPRSLFGQENDGRPARIVTSDQALKLEELPMRALIVGGGYIGCEFASLWSDLGVEVIMVEMLDRLLILSDETASEETYKALKRRGVKIRLGTKIERLTETGEGVKAELSEGESIEADVALVAVGRKLNSDVKGLAELGVKLKDGAVRIDSHARTNVNGVFAAGDVTGEILLAHYATHAGIVAVENMAGIDRQVEKRVVPSCVFTNPDIGQVGLSEREAREKLGEIRVGRFDFAHLGKALAMGEPEGFVKVVADARNDEVVGVIVVGHEASSLIGEAAMAMRMHAKLSDVAEMIHAHPTMPEGIMEAMLDAMGRSLHKIYRK